MELVIPTLLTLVTTLTAAEIILQPPKCPHFNSVNTENILHWSPAENGSQHIRYDVQYHRYGHDEESIPVSHCTGTAHCYCDLTEETWDVNITYYTYVRSVIGNTTSEWERTIFRPFDSTLLGLPSFVTEVEQDMITVQLFPPTLYTAKRNRSMEDVYPHRLKYIIYINASDTDRPEEIHSSGTPSKTAVRPGNMYCISIRAHLEGDSRKSNITEKKCIQIPNPDLETLINTVVGVFGAATTLLVLSFCLAMFCRHYVKQRRATPAVLETFGKNSKFLSKMNYLGFTEDVVVQKVFADGAHHSVTRTLDQDDTWPEQKMREASSVDSGIDIGSNTSGRAVLFDEVMNLYRQQTPDSSGVQSTDSECGQNSCQPINVCSVHIPAARTVLGNRTGDTTGSGYQRQMPRTHVDPEAAMSSMMAEPGPDAQPCTIPVTGITVAQDFTNTPLTLGDVMFMDNEL
ncbi:interleukin-10 receptor subunit alpha-like [Rhinoraja longicauda]